MSTARRDEGPGRREDRANAATCGAPAGGPTDNPAQPRPRAERRARRGGKGAERGRGDIQKDGTGRQGGPTGRADGGDNAAEGLAGRIRRKTPRPEARQHDRRRAERRGATRDIHSGGGERATGSRRRRQPARPADAIYWRKRDGKGQRRRPVGEPETGRGWLCAAECACPVVSDARCELMAM